MEKVERTFNTVADAMSEWLGTPMAFLLAFLTVLVWGILGPAFDFSTNWQLVINTGTTVVTYLMIFLVQSSQNKDTKTIHAKLDRILKDVPEVDDDLAGIEKDSYEARKV